MRDLQCHWTGCANLATHRAELVIYASVSTIHPPAIGAIGVYVCAEHATDATARQLLTDDAKRNTESGFAKIGRARPDWEKSFVRWVDL